MTKSCLLLYMFSATEHLTADIIPITSDANAQAQIETMRNKILTNTSKSRLFFNKYVLFRKPSVWVATLRPTDNFPYQIRVNDLTALPPTDALIQNTALDKALSKAINDPASPGWAFYNNMYGLYKDVFVELDEQDGTIELPHQALLVRYQTLPAVKRAVAGVGSVVSVIGGLVATAVRLGEES
ncbi:metalloprotease 1 [Colletotrichum fioriniae PJ7]|uniref:Metalloprotease 1 n=1 Tax=Colletotrichum fioriniae PJ7 TaxID=1445577 RepID=A0A010QJE6_9PEZI|nr:metalloprotease 1 [Colletotrichum fioriniae PJ7]